MAASTALLVVTTALCACGAGGAGGTVVRIGDSSLTKSTIDHWSMHLAGGHAVTDPSKAQTLRRQALELTISSQWLIGEAAEQGVGPSAQDIQAAYEQKKRTTFPGGDAEFGEFLKSTGQTPGDVKLEVEAELASARLRQALMSKEAPIASAQVASYYNAHRSSYALPERREVAITNRKSAAEADLYMHQVALGRSLAKSTLRGWFGRPRTLHPKKSERTTEGGLPIKDAIERAPLEQAIFKSKPNVLVGPVKFRVDYFIFEVKQIVPAKQTSLTEAQGAIAKKLASEQRRRTLAAFIKAWRAKWKARTSCNAGYVIEKCRQYRGPISEDPNSLS